jgi:hypothetical protein
MSSLRGSRDHTHAFVPLLRLALDLTLGIQLVGCRDHTHEFVSSMRLALEINLQIHLGGVEITHMSMCPYLDLH